MGYYNRAEIAACEAARRALRLASKVVNETQANCPHPSLDLSPRVRIHKPGSLFDGLPVRVCLRCSKALPTPDVTALPARQEAPRSRTPESGKP